MAATPDEILAALDPEQRAVAERPTGPMCVLAGAGTGKTRAITHRIAYGVRSGVYVPQRVLAVTFTARAAGEMRTRLRDLGAAGVQARTFHAAALRQLHYFWPRAIGGAAPEVMPHKAGAVAEAGARLHLQLDRPAIRDLAAEVEWAKVSLLTPESYPAAARHARRDPAGLDPTAMARLLQAYEEVKGERGVIDFEDVLLVMAGILDEHPAIAREVRGQYRHFVVDEYQDVNALQQRLLDLWVGDRQDVCVVGDAAQTIYSFTGASPAHLLGFSARYPEAAVVKLVRNYRSTPQIVGLANVMLRAQGQSGRGGVSRALVQLQAQAGDGPAPELTRYDDDQAEARGVAAAIKRQLAEGTPAAEIAVLFRTNAQSEAVESALAEEQIPYLVRGGERFFSRREVRDAMLLLRGQARGDDGSVPLGQLVRDVLAGVGWTTEAPASGGATRERWESLQALVALADDLVAAQPEARLPELVADLGERAAAQHAPTVQGVTLASLHSAKGLEWDVVHLLGCSDGLLPISMAEGWEAIEEERRLLYVGLTRARRRLSLSWAASRNVGGRASRRPSRFLDDAASVLGEGARSAPRRASGAAGGRQRSLTVARPAHCRVCGTELTTASERKTGRCGDCPPTYDEAVFESLRTWRKGAAAAASVPAYVVFTDATLTAIAERRPDDLGALASVSGVGARKLSLYGEPVLAILRGADPDEILAAARDSGDD
ncbi:ATP-dependent DNA helicase UvrD2 [Arsenicicoccus sp. oral taxon 190]|uniref:ATP-dependent DNA helicase UvrD2 n=1 Tax=Arsenicicoccus sp. oral taxon 190 TaxID=1658671 RepID=UPI00067A0ECE|nr:ATP-dependent DNA helicase UvrD2 [Arsenicicoccus sp. oral taxon 190]AKT51398.1 ATP-dependent DNA helicase [Arsenicicoccus sp. oral taxon 190]